MKIPLKRTHTRSWLRRLVSTQSFNLVELSLSVAVVAVGVVSVFGILPHLLQSSRQATEFSAIALDLQQFMDDPDHRGVITLGDLNNTAIFPTSLAPVKTNVQSQSFRAERSMSCWPATNADFSIILPTPANVYTNGFGKDTLKTVFITYRWGNTNNLTNMNTYTFITETTATQDILSP